jgi:asparagine synthase (glutamine-hydrolysing)
VLLTAYKEWGLDSFKKFNGMWAFMLFDESSDEIILCRDRFGVKPLYYTICGDFFLAGSEIKQFTAIPAFVPKLNRKVTANFLSKSLLNYSEHTFFEGVSELKAGHYMVYNLRSHQFSIHQWYDLAASIGKFTKSPKEAQKIYDLLVDSIRLRMRADVQVGSCLSGGIDSSSIVSLIHEKHMANGTFKTITSYYPDKEFDERNSVKW